MLQRYVTPIGLDDVEAVVPVQKGRASRKRRPVELLAIMQGLVIVSLLSWLVSGYRNVPEVKEWITGNMLLAGLMAAPLIVPLLAGVLIGGVSVYAMDRRLSREQRILENLLELIE